MSYERSIWENLLEKLCVERSLFRPSFPVKDMDVYDLQRAVMGPHLWDRLIQGRSAPPEEFPYGHTVASHYTLDLEELHGEKDIFLLPGGRYLFSCGSGATHHRPGVRLWDLGVPGHRVYRNPLQLAQYKFRRTNESRWVVRLSVYVPHDICGSGSSGSVQVLVVGFRSFGADNKFL